jgi:glutamate-1-semialdehyde 2,1-aminomutase
VLGAGGVVPAEKEFLEGLRELCDKNDILLIYDEVITGFRLAPGGGQEYFGVKPDITVLGKILGGGFPIGAFCGSKKIMERVDATAFKRPQYAFHGGTFSGNPITMIAGLTTLKMLEDGKVTRKLNRLGERIQEKLRQIFDKRDADVQVTGVGSLFNVHFTKERIRDALAVFRADRKKHLEFNMRMIAKGIFFLPTHCLALSSAHSKEDIDKLFRETEAYVNRSDRT